MNQADPNSTATQFEKMSPVLEMIYVMVKNMQKYLKVYAEDIGAGSLDEYQKTYEALNKVKETLDQVYHITDKPAVGSKPKEQLVMNKREEKPAPAMPLQAEELTPQPEPVAKAEEPVEEKESSASVEQPASAPKAADDSAVPASAAQDNSQVESILSELRKLQSSNPPAAN